MLEVSRVSTVDNQNPGAAAPSGNSADTSFEDQLQAAEDQLDEKYQNLALLPWGAVESIFQNIGVGLDAQYVVKKTSSAAGADTSANFSHPAVALNPNGEKQGNDQNDPAPTSQENSQQTAQKSLEQTIIQVNLAGSPFFMDALWGTNFSKMLSSRVELDALISKIVEQARLLKAGERKTLEVLLSPPDLGKIILSVTKEEGHINIRIFAAENAKNILEENISSLEESLKNANINIGSLAVTISHKRQESGPLAGDEPGPGKTDALPKELTADDVSIAVDAQLVKKLLGWLPKTSVYSKV